MSGNPPPNCPPCKLLLNGGGLAGEIAGIQSVKQHLNSQGLDFRPEFYAAATDIVCGAHKKLQKLAEDEVAAGNYINLP